MIRKILSALIISTTLLMFGCDNNPGGQPGDTGKPEKKVEIENKTGEKTPGEPENKNPEKVKAAQIMEVKIYYPDESGNKLVAVERKIEIGNVKEKYSAAVNELIKQPQEKYLSGIFPKNAKLIDVKVENGTAYVNFDKSVITNFVGGSTGEEFLVGSVVDTLTEFPEIKQVKFLIDGKEIETLAGHVDLSVPIKRIENLLK